MLCWRKGMTNATTSSRGDVHRPASILLATAISIRLYIAVHKRIPTILPYWNAGSAESWSINTEINRDRARNCDISSFCEAYFNHERFYLLFWTRAMWSHPWRVFLTKNAEDFPRSLPGSFAVSWSFNLPICFLLPWFGEDLWRNIILLLCYQGVHRGRSQWLQPNVDIVAWM